MKNPYAILVFRLVAIICILIMLIAPATNLIGWNTIDYRNHSYWVMTQRPSFNEIILFEGKTYRALVVDTATVRLGFEAIDPMTHAFTIGTSPVVPLSQVHVLRPLPSYVSWAWSARAAVVTLCVVLLDALLFFAFKVRRVTHS